MYGALLDMYGALLDMYGALLDMYGVLLDMYGLSISQMSALKVMYILAIAKFKTFLPLCTLKMVDPPLYSIYVTEFLHVKRKLGRVWGQ